jgi:uncharacterized glyoxalase superfamily metalloenzyme YdcJ
VVEEVEHINVVMEEQHHQEVVEQVEMDQVLHQQGQLIQVVVVVEVEHLHLFQDVEQPADRESLY